MVTVLLAVYNGEKYLAEQLDSLLNQTEKNVKILVRDDGSTDSSQDIIKDYAQKNSDKITVLSGEATGSSKQNFAALLSACNSEYIMFCDQDDVWHPQKIEKTLAAMKKAENGNSEKAVLVHSDLTVVDSKLQLIDLSFFKYQRLYQDNITLPRLLVQNYVTGCTVMVNRALVEKCGEIPKECIMHDWWLALVALLFGEIVCIKEPLMLYRQHSNNQVGAKASYGINLIKRKLATLDTVRDNYNATYVQARALRERYGDFLDKKTLELLHIYCQLPQKNKLQKITAVNKYDFKKGTTLRVLGQYFLM